MCVCLGEGGGWAQAGAAAARAWAVAWEGEWKRPNDDHKANKEKERSDIAIVLLRFAWRKWWLKWWCLGMLFAGTMCHDTAGTGTDTKYRRRPAFVLLST
jgi:hypothetical protein